ncbi:hypothetical protein ACH492_39375 [Streptomyces sp. NPDC019443]|uniref:hypothetical protein n=1 Tax=Streptomyces sp. NPDC019443 TaxID=3365061 RepID=UPI00379B5749
MPVPTGALYYCTEPLRTEGEQFSLYPGRHNLFRFTLAATKPLSRSRGIVFTSEAHGRERGITVKIPAG